MPWTKGELLAHEFWADTVWDTRGLRTGREGGV